MVGGMQGHQQGDAEFHREQFSPAKHGERVAEVFNKQRIEQLEARVKELEDALKRIKDIDDFHNDACWIAVAALKKEKPCP